MSTNALSVMSTNTMPNDKNQCISPNWVPVHCPVMSTNAYPSDEHQGNVPWWVLTWCPVMHTNPFPDLLMLVPSEFLSLTQNEHKLMIFNSGETTSRFSCGRGSLWYQPYSNWFVFSTSQSWRKKDILTNVLRGGTSGQGFVEALLWATGPVPTMWEASAGCCKPASWPVLAVIHRFAVQTGSCVKPSIQGRLAEESVPVCRAARKERCLLDLI